MLKGYVDAYRAFDEPAFLNKTIKKRQFFKYSNYHEINEVMRNYKK
jgi:hypothetical protein